MIGHLNQAITHRKYTAQAYNQSITGSPCENVRLPNFIIEFGHWENIHKLT